MRQLIGLLIELDSRMRAIKHVLEGAQCLRIKLSIGMMLDMVIESNI